VGFIFLIVGLAITVKSADVLIESTSKIAAKYGVSSFIIGITVIAFGTSAPELVVGIMSAAQTTNQLTLGTIIGSSYANMALIIGIAAIMLPLTVRDTVARREMPMLILVQGILAFMVLSDGKLTRTEGIILLVCFAGFIAYIIMNSKNSSKISIGGEEDIDVASNLAAENSKQASLAKLWILCIASLVGLYVGGKLSVDSSMRIAENFGISETIIGLTVVAVGTSLPELVTSIIAVKKNEPDMVLGNCVGSNIFNTLMVLGLSSAISPFSVQDNITFDALLIIFLNAFVLVVSFFTKKIHRLSGIILVLSYIGYISYKIIMALA
jgi:K+-dependent Na+/Ca+ exchanger related-protein